MPTREVLTPAQRGGFLSVPEDIPQSEVERYYTFTLQERAYIQKKRRPHNRLGFAVQWAYLRFPGRPWEPTELPPDSLLLYVAEQIGVATAELSHYSLGRDTTRREHLQELITLGHFRPYDARAQRELSAWLLPIALSTDSGVKLLEALVTQMRADRIVLPALSVLERLVWEIRRSAQAQATQALTESLTAEQKTRLDALLLTDLHQSPHQTMLTWVRQASGKTAPVTILRFIERIRFLRSIGLPPRLARTVHQNRLQSLAREGGRYTPQFLARTSPERRYAILVAFVLETLASLSDQVLSMHDRMIQQMMRRAEQSHQEAFQRSGKAINDKVRLLARVGKALITARQEKADPFAAIEAVVGWAAFTTSVAEAEELARPAEFDHLDHAEGHYRQIHRYAPAMLSAFEFRGTEPMKPLLAALDLLRRLNADELRKVPADAPTRFVRARWRDYVFTDKGIDRRYYELCVLTELRAGLRSGDISVSGSSQFRDFEEHLLPQEQAQAAAPGLAVEQDAGRYLARRKVELDEALARVNGRLLTGDLEGVRLAGPRLVVSPLPSLIPADAEDQTRRAYDILPSIRITDLLVEVDRWTAFTRHFTALRQGTPPER